MISELYQRVQELEAANFCQKFRIDELENEKREERSTIQIAGYLKCFNKILLGDNVDIDEFYKKLLHEKNDVKLSLGIKSRLFLNFICFYIVLYILITCRISGSQRLQST